MLLMELPELVGPFCDGMAKDVRAEFETRLNSFAMRAAQALELSSIFYMGCPSVPGRLQGRRSERSGIVHRSLGASICPDMDRVWRAGRTSRPGTEWNSSRMLKKHFSR